MRKILKINQKILRNVLISSVGMVVYVWFASVLNDNAIERTQSRFDNIASLQYKTITNSVNDGENALHSLNGLFITAWPISSIQFHMYTRGLIKRYPFIDNFTYEVSLTDEERLSFEEKYSQNIPGFKLTERNGIELTVAQSRKKYVVTNYIEPYMVSRIGINNGLTYEESINKGMDIGLLTTTRVFNLPNQESQKKAVMLWFPLYQGGMFPSSVLERHNNLVGFTTVTLKIEDLIATAIKEAGIELNKNTYLEIVDKDSGDALYSLNGESNEKIVPYIKNLKIGSRNYQLTVKAKAGQFQADRTAVWVTIYGGILMSILLGLFLYSRQRVDEQKQKEEENKLKAAEQQHLLEQLKSESERLTNIIETQSEISRADFDLKEFMHLAVERLVILTKSDGALIEMQEGEETVVLASVGFEALAIGTRMQSAGSLSGLCLRTKSVQVCNDTLTDDRVNKTMTDKLGMRSLVAIPLINAGVAIGVLKVLSNKPYKFNDRDVQTLKVLANVIGNAIQQRLSMETKTSLLLDMESLSADLFKEKELAQITLRAIGDAVITTDIQGNVTYLNPVAEQLTGWSNQEAKNFSILEVFNIIHETTKQPVSNPVLNALRLKKIVGMNPATVLVHKDGTTCAVDDSAAPIFDREGEAIGAVLVFRDVSQERALTSEISYQASHDALTGLLNRNEFNKHIALAIQKYKESSRNSALLFLDLDQFKIVNDTCGHAAGDELLIQVTEMLTNNVREHDTVARLGGDEFGILLNGCHLEPAQKIAEKLREQIECFRFHWERQVFSIGVSIGLVTLSSDVTDLKKALSAADSACYVAKEKGRNQVCVYEPSAADQAERANQIGWVVRIQKALDENRLVLFAQSIVPVDNKLDSPSHYEMLLRMYDEEGKLVPPMAFIPAAERYNLMATIDKWVVRTSLVFMRTHPYALCSVNLSGQSMCDEKFLEFVEHELKSSRVNCANLCFEVTETTAIASFGKAIEFMQRLKQYGCCFALDDFGSGMSSFNYLKQLPVDYLKIDGGFVKNMARDPIDHAMVESINNIGHIMGLKTIAEFVEDDEILRMLGQLGVDYAQGYGIGKPMNTDSIKPKPQVIELKLITKQMQDNSES